MHLTTVIWRILDRFPGIALRVRAQLTSPTRLRLARGAFWGVLAGVSVRLFSVVTSFLVARMLGRELFGEYGVVANTTALIGSLAGFGVGITATKYIAEYRQRDPDRAGRIIGLSTLVTITSGIGYAAIFVLLAPWLAERTLAAPHLASLLRLNALGVLLGVVNGSQTCSLAGFEAFKVSAFVNAATGVFQALASLVGCWFGGLHGLIIAALVSAVLTTLINRLVLQREMRLRKIRVHWRDVFREWRILWTFSLPAFLGSMMVAPVFWACNAMLANQPNGYSELGIFNAANQWYTAILFLPSLMSAATLPVLSERFSSGDTMAAYRIMKGMMVINIGVVAPLVLILCLLSKTIMLGYGQSFVSGYWALVLTVVTAGLLAMMAPVGQIIAASGRMWTGFLMNAGWAVVLLGSSSVMIRWGAIGLAGSRLLAYMVHAIWVIAYVLYLLRRSPGSSIPAVGKSTASRDVMVSGGVGD